MSLIKDKKAFEEAFTLKTIELTKSAIAKCGSDRKLAKEIGVRYPSLASWTMGVIPTDKNILKLEDYINGN